MLQNNLASQSSLCLPSGTTKAFSVTYLIPQTAKEKSIRDWNHLFLTVQNYEVLAAALIVFFSVLLGWLLRRVMIVSELGLQCTLASLTSSNISAL